MSVRVSVHMHKFSVQVMWHVWKSMRTSCNGAFPITWCCFVAVGKRRRRKKKNAELSKKIYKMNSLPFIAGLDSSGWIVFFFFFFYASALEFTCFLTFLFSPSLFLSLSLSFCFSSVCVCFVSNAYAHALITADPNDLLSPPLPCLTHQ